MQYVSAKVEEKQDELLYRIYVTDLLRGLAGADISRYYDMISGESKKPEKTAEEVRKCILDEFKKMEVS